MKIGILTHPLRGNYGGILQAWALQQIVKKLGFKPETIDWDFTVTTWYSFFRNIPGSLHASLCSRKFIIPHSPKYIQKKYRGLRSFIKKNISLSKRIPLRKIIPYISKKYRIVVVGSDQVWRPEYIHEIDTMFLPYPKKKDSKKIAYAASFGTDIWEFNEDQTAACTKLISDFDAVSVREHSALNLLSNNLNLQNAERVLDPTLLLSKDIYSTLCEKIKKDDEGYVFAYILDKDPSLTLLAKKKSEELKLPLKILSVDQELNENDSVEAWLASFRDAKYVITDSFHGTIFSLIFRKEFAVWINIQRGSARFENLLDLFPQINYRIIHGDNLPDSIINWESIEDSCNIFRKKSIDFLKQALTEG